RDITYRLEVESKLRFLADHDVLTNLYNRRRFERELEREVKMVKRFGGEGAILVLDIDNFKAINDSLGHRAGDEVISRVAQIVRDSLREVDIVARLGGDEFAVFIPDGDGPEVASRLVDAVHDTVLAFGDRMVRTTVSVGIAPVNGHSVSDEELMIRADLAMYEAKAAGRDQFAVYRTGSGDARRATEGLRLSERIRTALTDDRLRVFAQPILDRRRNFVSQYELLVRMDGMDGGMVQPADFLPTADRFGLSTAIDRWMLERAVAILSDSTLLDSESSIQVNLSARSMVDPALCGVIERSLEEHAIDPWRLVIEVTETNVIDNMDQARIFATRLASFGCRFALDDFGAGFGSFYYLKHLPFEFLKIDGNFIRQLPANRTDQHMVEAIINLAHRLGKRTIAECVEDNETIDLLCGFGIDFIQGYHVGRPHPAEEMSLLARGPEAG
ncbi:MAG: EAL domain-containing protein, partial [Actinomycetota bacterium]|nr:EAL domain-containing protein [Actinomycetota bacterium]